jgi:CelD/BcsL family acetyltransferase involved in cellulose biosynthesis
VVFDTVSGATILSIDTRAINVHCVPQMDDPLAAEWDELLARSDADTVFLTSGWLRAWHESLGRDETVLYALIRCCGRLEAAGAFQIADGVVQFAGTGPSDYSDFVVRDDVDERQRADLTQGLMHGVKRETSGFRYFKLGRIRPESATLRAISPASNFYATVIGGSVAAPYMDMACVDDRLRKKSLRRHDRGLERQGKVECHTFVSAEDVLPQLDSFFFDQHVRRWKSTGVESLFTREANREFYRCMTRRLGPTGQLRFTTIRLDGVPVAAHFGFLHAKRFIWYKPTFEPELSKLSPGEVLIKRLFEQAKAEGAIEFDFTIGSEAFKYRFASGVRQVVYVHVTDSRFTAFARRGRALAGRTVRKLLGRDKTAPEGT